MLRQGRYFKELAGSLKEEIDDSFHRGHLKTPTCLEASILGNKVFSGGNDCCIWLWDTEGEKQTLLKGEKHNRSQPGHFDEVLALSLSNDERTLLSGGKDRLVYIWDLRTESVVKKLRGHRDYITVGEGEG